MSKTYKRRLSPSQYSQTWNNAEFAAVEASQSDGPYLPLTGGTVSGHVVFADGFEGDANPVFVASGDSNPGGVPAAATSALHLHRPGTFGFSFNEDAELRVAHGGPSTTGSNVELWVNAAGNTTGIPDEKVATFRYDGSVAITGPVGFNGAAPVAKPAVTGSRGGNVALASLLTALATLGLITDSSTP